MEVAVKAARRKLLSARLWGRQPAMTPPISPRGTSSSTA